jgi:hypothetical protein
MRCFDHVAKPNQLDHGLQLDLVGYTGIHVGGAWNFGIFFISDDNSNLTWGLSIGLERGGLHPNSSRLYHVTKGDNQTVYNSTAVKLLIVFF